MYKNEAMIGAALRGQDLRRPFLVSKLQGDDHGAESTARALDQTLSNLGVDVLDVWLMHNPSGGKVVETWTTMLAARDAGRVRPTPRTPRTYPSRPPHGCL
jgi:diketogulonate reductase-like aldo/keto reductase